MFNEQVEMHFKKYKEELDKRISFYKTELVGIKAGRANSNILNKVFVDYYGTMTPISQMANISVPEARMLVIAPWDISTIRDITKAILASDIGITPSDDGKLIRLNFPMLTEERRKDLVKSLKKTAEESKVALRNERRTVLDIVKKLKNDKIVTEDELQSFDKDVQKILDNNIIEIDKLTENKEKEIMTV